MMRNRFPISMTVVQGAWAIQCTRSGITVQFPAIFLRYLPFSRNVICQGSPRNLPLLRYLIFRQKKLRQRVLQFTQGLYNCVYSAQLSPNKISFHILNSDKATVRKLILAPKSMPVMLICFPNDITREGRLNTGTMPAI